MKKTYLIVGQGIVGTNLGLHLDKNGHSVNFIDNFHHNAASKVAAGLINPVTGKRIVKSWMVDTLLPYSLEFFSNLEYQFDKKFVYPLNIIRLLQNQMEENDWLARTSVNDLHSYILENLSSDDLDKINILFSKGYITNSYRIDIQSIIDHYNIILRQEKRISQVKLNYKDINFKNENVFYQDKQFDGIIFCEGAKMIENPFFNYLPLKPTKGEALIIDYEDVITNIIKNKTALIPINDNHYWIGGTNDWNFEDENPTEDKKNLMREEWSFILKHSFTIQSHKAAIRPATFDRFPFIGVHPKYNNLFIFNGFGTKATLMSPYFANHFVDFLTNNTSLLPEINCNRFKI